ncbi:hypothetical protein TSOC_008774 [Tetrabaena socialis]|uniref:Uncharacterized protein n=1 Tax=Tetrabaena socialis TaxID=47790 RepID=A0A2J7ZXL5_9CHLO|nr:hypothetical protein TSOC_008774 [Tetrabaena socialis]|eukprot:PNH05009.1 hypothetical protein TSOC_008774 [Tetrabaena socialis]
MEALRPATVQRLLGFSAGTFVASLVYVSTARLVWRQTSEAAQQLGAPAPRKVESTAQDQPLLGPKFWATMTRRWNQGVDATVGALATELAKRGI